ncbi:MAG TPA: pitrilysin family protein [Gemmatimonadales bacterium]|jgi:zinc protease
MLRHRLLLVACTLTAAPLLAQQPRAVRPAVAAAPVRGATVEGVTEYTMANGLRILLFPDASKPTTTVNITYLVGSRSEAYGESGMAHLLEHMVFKGTPRHANIPQELSERGASPNGSTWYDRTNYFETFPAKDDNLHWALDLEADRMVHSYIAQKDLNSEMTVVRNEFESGENSPDNILIERVMSTAYLWHNYGKSTIGPKSDLEHVPIERLQGFYHKYYQPDNAVLVVAGKFEPATALRMIQQTFGVVPRPNRTGAMKIWPTYTLDPPQDGERTVTLRRVGDVQALAMAWHVPAGSHPDFPALDVLTEVLASQPTGRLYQAAVVSKKASSVSAYTYQLREPGVLIVSAQVPKTDDMAAAQQAINQAIQTLLTTAPPTAEEVDRAKASLLTGINLQLTNSSSIGLEFSEWAAMGDWRLLYLHRDGIKAVTPDDVIRVARAYLKTSNRTTGIFVPDAQPDRSVIPPTPDIVAAVTHYRGDTSMVAGEAFDASPANIDARTKTGALPGGLTYALLPKKTRGGTVTAQVVLRFGTAQSLMNKGAAPDLAGAMLMRGTRQLTRQQMTDSLNRLGAEVFVGGSSASASASITVKREHLADAIRLAVQMLRQPSFDAKEFELARQEEVTAIESQRSEPTVQAELALERHLSPYPKGHPNYVGTVDEELADLHAVTLDEARQFYHDFYGASHGEIALVGDFDPDSVRTLLSHELSDWKSPGPFVRIGNPSQSSAPLNISLETPDKANAMFLAGKTLAVSDRSADYPALVLGNYMLGGGFLNSRLATRIRQKDGLSYGVGSNLAASPIDTSGTFMTYAIYAPVNRDKLEQAFTEEMVRAAKDGFTAEEVLKAKEGWTENAKLGRSNDNALAGRLVQNLYLHRRMVATAELEARVNALTPAEVQAAVAKYLDPASMAIVKAGDFDKKVAGPPKP